MVLWSVAVTSALRAGTTLGKSPHSASLPIIVVNRPQYFAHEIAAHACNKALVSYSSSLERKRGKTVCCREGEGVDMDGEREDRQGAARSQ